VIFGPWVGSALNAVGLLFAAVIAYGIAMRTNRLLDVNESLARLPSWVRRLRAGSPLFLIVVRMLPGIGGTLATQTAAAYRVSIWTQIWTKLIVAVPICTALSIGGDRVAVFVHDRITQPVRAYVVRERRHIHLPQMRRWPRPSSSPEQNR
jgi:uncharacterized membrane protein YdjX (TVP38/TMEM64 family)